ncbi:hypothetical protein J4219_00895 [Candidatus Woesearchaeota archaeon]|nr:hypothetical protein [Candidatus Woesearchaeota archaeon]
MALKEFVESVEMNSLMIDKFIYECIAQGVTDFALFKTAYGESGMQAKMEQFFDLVQAREKKISWPTLDDSRRRFFILVPVKLSSNVIDLLNGIPVQVNYEDTPSHYSAEENKLYVSRLQFARLGIDHGLDENQTITLFFAIFSHELGHALDAITIKLHDPIEKERFGTYFEKACLGSLFSKATKIRHKESWQLIQRFVKDGFAQKAFELLNQLMHYYFDTKYDPAFTSFFYNRSTNYPQWSTTGVSVLEGYTNPLKKEEVEKLLESIRD